MSVEHLKKYLTSVQLMHFKKDSVVFNEGDESNGKMYFIFSGLVEVYRKKASGENQFIRLMGPGEFFGELALVFPSPRAATVIATADDTKVGIITKDIFISMGKDSPEFLSVLLHTVIKRLTAVEDSITEKQKFLHTLINGIPQTPPDPILANLPKVDAEGNLATEEVTPTEPEPEEEENTGFIPPTT